MFESVTYEGILADMLGKATELYPDLDTREGSVLYTALAPAAVEMINLYMALDTVLDMSFPDTAASEYLIRRCAERGIMPSSATCSVIAVRCLPEGIYVPAGTRFSCDGSTYAVSGGMLDEYYIMECEVAGSTGNRSGGILLPLTYVEGLTSASIASLTVPGEDAEDTELLRQRYFDSFESQAFGGNVKDYREKVTAINGVGGVKVYPAYAGGGTVKLVIIGSNYGVPSETLVKLVQSEIDPIGSEAEGLGLAPIGHAVRVEGVKAKSIGIDISITYQDSWSWEDIQTYVCGMIDEYLLELNGIWADSESIIVRVSQIETRILDLDGVSDITGILINGQASNVTLGDDEIPVRGVISG